MRISPRRDRNCRNICMALGSSDVRTNETKLFQSILVCIATLFLGVTIFMKII